MEAETRGLRGFYAEIVEKRSSLTIASGKIEHWFISPELASVEGESLSVGFEGDGEKGLHDYESCDFYVMEFKHSKFKSRIRFCWILSVWANQKVELGLLLLYLNFKYRKFHLQSCTRARRVEYLGKCWKMKENRTGKKGSTLPNLEFLESLSRERHELISTFSDQNQRNSSLNSFER